MNITELHHMHSQRKIMSVRAAHKKEELRAAGTRKNSFCSTVLQIEIMQTPVSPGISRRSCFLSIYEVLAAVQSASSQAQRGDEKRVGRTQALLFIKMLPICERANCGATVKIYCPSGKKCAARTIEK
jgi:hypothetical protein